MADLQWEAIISVTDALTVAGSGAVPATELLNSPGFGGRDHLEEIAPGAPLSIHADDDGVIAASAGAVVWVDEAGED